MGPVAPSLRMKVYLTVPFPLTVISPRKLIVTGHFPPYACGDGISVVDTTRSDCAGGEISAETDCAGFEASTMSASVKHAVATIVEYLSFISLTSSFFFGR